MKLLIISLAAAAFLSLTGCRTTPPPSAWEYRVNFETRNSKINDWAKDGWIVINGFYDTDWRSY